MEVLRQFNVGLTRYKKGDRLDPQKLSKETIQKLLESGHLKAEQKAKGATK